MFSQLFSILFCFSAFMLWLCVNLSMYVEVRCLCHDSSQLLPPLFNIYFETSIVRSLPNWSSSVSLACPEKELQEFTHLHLYLPDTLNPEYFVVGLGFWDRVSLCKHPWLSWNLLCRPSWPQNYRDPLASISWVLSLKACSTTAWLYPAFFT